MVLHLIQQLLYFNNSILKIIIAYNIANNDFEYTIVKIQ